MRESHIRHLKLSSRAQLLLLELTPHQQRLQQSWRHFHYKATVLYVCWCLPPLVLTNDVFDPCGQILHMHTFPSARVQHSALIQRKPHFSFLLSHLQLLPKPPMDLQGTSMIHGSRTS